MIKDERLNTFKQFSLPDTKYRDPREFANNLNIPAHRALAQREASLLQKIAPWALVGAIGIWLIFMIATANPPPPTSANQTASSSQEIQMIRK
jgi:cytoskeletal protein RodZ